MDPIASVHQIFFTNLQIFFYQAFGKESMSHTRKVQSNRNRKRKKARQGKSKVKSMLLHIEGNCSLIRPGRRKSQFRIYCHVLRDCAKMYEDFTPNFGDKGDGCCITYGAYHTYFFTRHLFLPKPTRLSSPTHPTFLPFKVKLKICHFDTTDVNESESQEVLNTLTEHDF
jgi:hypothetical protein